MDNTMKTIFLNFKTTALLGIFSIINVAIWYYRCVYYDSMAYRGLLWNLFLAWIPYIVSLLVVNFYRKLPNKILFLPVFALLAVVWLLFFPNAPYIITDLIHLGKRKFPHIPLWYDAIMIFSFALTGLLLGFLSLQFVHEITRKITNKLTAWLFVILSLLACAFGIYLGRIERWNSWDVVSEKKSMTLLSSVLQKALYPLKFWESTSMTLLFFVLLLIGYLTFKAIVKQVIADGKS